MVLEQKCKLLTPTILGQGFHRCRQKSEFLVSHYEKSQNWGFACYLLVQEQKCQLPTPHNFGSRVPSLSTEIWISRQPLWKITKLGFYMVPGGPRAKVSTTDPPHNFGSRVPSLSTEIGISGRPLWKITKLGFYTVPGGPRAKVSITDPPTILGQGFHRCQRKSKFHLWPLWKITKLGFYTGPWWS